MRIRESSLSLLCSIKLQCTPSSKSPIKPNKQYSLIVRNFNHHNHLIQYHRNFSRHLIKLHQVQKTLFQSKLFAFSSCPTRSQRSTAQAYLFVSSMTSHLEIGLDNGRVGRFRAEKPHPTEPAVEQYKPISVHFLNGFGRVGL